MNESGAILFAEDNPHDVELTLAGLAEYNLANAVIVVSDGTQALDYLYCRGRFAKRAAGNPTLILLDLKMPKIDGLEVLRIIKADENLRSIPVVMLTSSVEEQDLARSYKYGVNSYVLKPVGFQAFVEAVKNLGVYWIMKNQPPGTAGPADSSRLTQTNTSSPTLRILHLEDNAADAELTQLLLEHDWPGCRVDRVYKRDDFISALQGNPYDLILSDSSLPQFDGLSALALAREGESATPFIFFSGAISEERATEAFRQGATACVIKDRPALLVTAIRQALARIDEAKRVITSSALGSPATAR